MQNKKIKNIKEIMCNEKNKIIKQNVRRILLILIVIGVFFTINTILNQTNIKTIDITEDKIYTLSDKTKKIVQDIDKKINIYFFGFEEQDAVVKISKQYNDVNSNIHSEIIDIEKKKEIAQKYEVDSEEDIGVIIEIDDKYKVLSVDELYEFDENTFRTIDHSEEKITNAINDLVTENKKQAYFLSGHGEYHVNNGLETIAAKIYNEQYDVKVLDFLQTNAIPETCDILIISSPQEDFYDLETEEIIKYINNGGNILWLEDPMIEKKEFKNRNKILDCYGIRFSEGVIFETDSSKIVSNNQKLIVPQQDNHSITKKLNKSKIIVLAYTGKLEIKSDEELDKMEVEVVPILKTTKSSFRRINLDLNENKMTEEDEEGGFIISAEFTKKLENSKESKMIAIANNLFVTDQTIKIQDQSVNIATIGNNSNFILNAVRYLTNKELAVEITKKDSSVIYTATKLEDTIIRLIITILPCIIFLTGIIVWNIRKKR